MNDVIGMLMQAARNGGNPMQLLQGMARNNPQIGQAMNIIQGKNPQQLEQVARNMAKERGIDIEAMARQMGLM